MMKKLGLFLAMVVMAFSIWAQDFTLPKVETNVDSVQRSFMTLLNNISAMGFVDYDSSWAGNTTRYKNYLDSVLTNMDYERLKLYVTEIETVIQNIDYSNISKHRQTEFEEFMSAGHGTNIFAKNFFNNMLDFKGWVAFFKNENNDIREYLIWNKSKDGLYQMLDDIQQRYYDEYKAKLDAFCAGWGI